MRASAVRLNLYSVAVQRYCRKCALCIWVQKSLSKGETFTLKYSSYERSSTSGEALREIFHHDTLQMDTSSQKPDREMLI